MADEWDKAVRCAYARITQEFPELGIEGRELLLAIMVENFQVFAERATRYETIRDIVSDLAKGRP